MLVAIGPPPNIPQQAAGPVPAFPPLQGSLPPLMAPTRPGRCATIDPSAPQPLSFSELRHGRPAVGVVSPRSARRQRGEPTPAPFSPADMHCRMLRCPIGRYRTPLRRLGSSGSNADHESPPVTPALQLQRLPPVNLFAPPPREPPRRLVPQPGLPQPPIPFYPQTGY